MSLVNKMLRDLDARHVSDVDRAALPTAMTPLAARQEPGRDVLRLWLGIILLVTGLGAAAWYAVQTRSPSEAPVIVPVVVPAPPLAEVVTVPVPAASAQAPVPAANPELLSLRMEGQLSTVPPTDVGRKPRKAAMPKPAERSLAVAAPSRSSRVVLPRIPAAAGETRIDKQVHLPPSSTERAEAEYRRGVLAQRQGNADEAAGSYRTALADYPEHAAARQTLAAMLIEAKRFDDAEDILRKGVELVPVRLASTLALARLKVERNQAPAALELLQKNAAAGERSAEYQGFAGALLNRAGHAAEAAERYQAATRLAPGEGRWWAGLGIALDAAGKSQEAREAYQKARSLPGLPTDLAQHIEQRLR